MVTGSETEGRTTDVWHETQWMRGVWWVVLAVGAIAVLSWAGFVQQILLGRPYGTHPGPDWSVWLIWLGFGIAFPILFWFLRLSVEVSPQALYIHYLPLLRRRIPLSEIVSVRARSYNPVLEYGGWGIRGWWRGRTIYSVRGTQCVEIELQSGRIVAIGSQRADELAAAVQQRQEV